MAKPVLSSDAAYERAYRRWMLVHGLTLPGAISVYALGLTLLYIFGQSPLTAVIGSMLLALAGLALMEGAIWLETHNWLGRLFRRVNMRASIAAERLARDDDHYVVEGVQDVVFEWRHVEVIQRDRDWAGLALAALSMVSLALGFVLSALVIRYWGWVHASPLAVLTLASAAGGFALARSVMRYACFSRRDFDPTDILQSRLIELLTEVKDLRRAGIRSSS